MEELRLKKGGAISLLTITKEGKILVLGEETDDDKVISDAVREWASSIRLNL